MSHSTQGAPGARQLMKIKRTRSVPVLCLRCQKEFSSWDPRNNRICPKCTVLIAALVDRTDAGYLYAVTP